MSTSLTERYRLTPNQLDLWLKFIEHQVGFVLPSSQVNWVKGVIERHLQQTQLSSTELLEAIAQDTELYHRLFDDILIPRTQFFRHLPSFNYIARYTQQWQTQIQQLDKMAQPTQFIGWSVGCSTGQEPMSMAMTIRQHLAVTQRFRVFASDFHQKALQRAKIGEYDFNELMFIPPQYHHYLELQTPRFTLKPNLKQSIHYFSQNIVEFNSVLPIKPKQCQIILCKNVLIYFRQFEQRDIVGHLCEYLADDGIIIFGVGELLQLMNLPLIRLPIATVNAYCKVNAPDWVKQLKI